MLLSRAWRDYVFFTGPSSLCIYRSSEADKLNVVSVCYTIKLDTDYTQRGG